MEMTEAQWEASQGRSLLEDESDADRWRDLRVDVVSREAADYRKGDYIAKWDLVLRITHPGSDYEYDVFVQVGHDAGRMVLRPPLAKGKRAWRPDERTLRYVNHELKERHGIY